MSFAGLRKPLLHFRWGLAWLFLMSFAHPAVNSRDCCINLLDHLLFVSSLGFSDGFLHNLLRLDALATFIVNGLGELLLGRVQEWKRMLRFLRVLEKMQRVLHVVLLVFWGCDRWADGDGQECR